MILWSVEVLQLCHSLAYRYWEYSATLTLTERLITDLTVEKEKDCKGIEWKSYTD